MANDILYHEVAEIIRSVLAKEQSVRKAVYGNTQMRDDAASSIRNGEETVHEEPKCNPFGTRYLTDEDRVWEHNAWDNVNWSEEMEEHARKVVEIQKTQAIDYSKAKELVNEPAKQWDAFYSQHNNNFFKDRNWLLKEFPELDMNNYSGDSTVRVLEVGCGVGNTSLPLIQWDEHRRMFLYSCDYSDVAVQVLKQNDSYDSTRICGFVWDITQEAPVDAPAKDSLDYVVCIYVLSAIHPSKVRVAIDNLVALLKPGGMLLLKDYGRFDLTQLRFKKDRYIEENLYCRGDGTLVYFFTKDELDELLRAAGLVQQANFVDKRLIVNRAKQNKKSLLRLSCETLRFRSLFDEILKDPELHQIADDPEIKGDVNLAYVLLYEFLAGAGLGRASPRLRGVIYRHTKAIHDREKALAADGRGVAAIKESGQETESASLIPRYARINTLKWTKEEAIETLSSEDWNVIQISPEDDFAKRVGSMTEDEVLIDPHVENLLIFPHSNEFHRYWLVEQRYLILQDKASCLPAFLLDPPPGSQVFDTCAAPGMKTSHVASIIGGTGKVWAMDRSEERVGIMNQILEECGVENASVFHGDFLKTDVTDKKFSKVKYAIVDPPCSGSGMVKRLDELTGGNADKSRLEKLKNLQAMILKHALKFPKLQRAVYSTCSIHEEENEQVVDEVLLDTYVRQHFRLSPFVLPNWTHRGLGTYEFGNDCLRADPAKTLTNGFFVAVFKRISESAHAEEGRIKERKKKYGEVSDAADAIEKKDNDKKRRIEEVSRDEDACTALEMKKKKKSEQKRK
ncbi:hypothetical protein RB195_016663 [Necator americanus]|uniref:SAM-dependent MTase RsmB/NOP-type domain-containing protein n=1 Tax=Necator americanus TaxID=51031 RepID=A0ABR1C590_NECAM